MKKYLFLLACLGFLMAQCHKESDYYDTFVGGYIIGTHDSKPVPNALTELVELKQYAYVGSAESYIVLDSMIVGNSGRLKFNFTAKKGTQYGIRARHPRYRYYAPTVSFFSPGSSDQDSVNFGMVPYSYLRVHIKDTSRTENYLGIYFLSLSPDGDVTIWKTPLDTTVVLQHVYFPLWFSWQLKYANNRVGSQNRESIQCAPLDTCDINVRF